MTGFFFVVLVVLTSIALTDSLSYVVYPENRKNIAACASINSFLTGYLGLDDVTAYSSITRGVTEFWLVQASESQQEVIANTRGLGSI